MNARTKRIAAILLAGLFAIALLVAAYYLRQRLFTRTEPIVLTS